LELALVGAHGSLRRGDAAVGDVLKVRAHLQQSHVELRIYRAAKLVVRCPDSEPCKHDGAAIELGCKLDAPGSYQIVALSSASDIPGPSATLDRDLLMAREAGAHIDIEYLTVSR